MLRYGGYFTQTNMNTKLVLQKLISIKSYSGHEEEIQKYIFNYLKNSGQDPLWVCGNVVVKIPGKSAKKAVILNAHVDTVSIGNEKLWIYPPLDGKIVKNKIFGLGASDEKAAVAVILNLATSYLAEKPECDVWLTFVISEEVDGSGTKQFVEWFNKKHQKKYVEVSAILGEPTGLKKIEIGHKGNIFIKVTSMGDSGHGSQPEKIKKNAIKIIYKLVEKLEEESKKWSKKYDNEFLGIPTISLTSISAGDISSPNKFADSCIASFDIRTTPEVHKKAFGLIKQIVQKVDKKIKVEYLFPPASYGYTNIKGQIVQIASELTKAKIAASFGSNDTCFFTQLGIPAIVFGPGEPSCIHKPNEYCKLEKIKKCELIYKEIIRKYGGKL